MAYTGSGVVTSGFPLDDFTFTYLISGLADAAAVNAAPGKVVAIDTGAAATVKLAGDGDEIFGRVRTAEDRDVLGIKTAAIARKFKERVPAATGHGIVVGDSVVGAGNGLVKKAAEANGTVVIETGTDYVVVEKL